MFDNILLISKKKKQDIINNKISYKLPYFYIRESELCNLEKEN